MKRKINLGVLGPGNIASVVSEAIMDIEGINFYAVASRSLEKAKEFASKFNFNVAYGSYEEMLADDKVDLVYIATPHAFHYEHMMMCIKYKKNIICEKAFCLNQKDAIEVLESARANDVFVCEALITGFLPSSKVIRDLLNSKVIGDVKSFYGVFGTEIMHVDRVVKKELGGGALFDIGIYPLYFCLSTLGWDAEVVDVKIDRYNDIDRGEVVTLRYPNGVEAIIEANVDKDLGMYGEIKGSNGRMYIPNIARPTSIVIYDIDDNLVEKIENLRTTTGYEFEFISSIEAIQNNQIETKEMPHKHTIDLLGFIDRILIDL